MRKVIVSLVAALCAGSLATRLCAAEKEYVPAGDDKKIKEFLDRVKVELPENVDLSPRIRPSLVELSREPCDQEAIMTLANGLKTEGYKREAADALVGFSDICGGHVDALREASNILLAISDYDATEVVASELIKLEPHSDNGYFLRAMALDKGGRSKRAIDDFATAIELFANKEKISSFSYSAIARNYEKLGQFCDAAGAIEMWVNANPVRNDNSQSRSIIGGYRSKGKCPAATGKEEVLPVSGGSNVALVPVTINGVKGRFILDTGASFVAVNGAFAAKANIGTEPDSAILIHTANGAVIAHRARAKTVELKSLKTSDVQVVVPGDRKGVFAPGADGLLGMSFLSRFEVKIDGKQIRVRGRPAG